MATYGNFVRKFYQMATIYSCTKVTTIILMATCCSRYLWS